MGLWRAYRWRMLTTVGRVPQMRTRMWMGSQSDLPHRRVAPVQSVHQLHREPMPAVGKERGSQKVSLPLWLGTVPERTRTTWAPDRLRWAGSKGQCVCV